MQKNEVTINFILGAILSSVLSFIGTARGGHFTVDGWLTSVFFSLCLSQLVGVLIPSLVLVEGACKKLSIKKESFKGIAVGALIINLVYIPIMSGSMGILMTWISSKNAPKGALPPMLLVVLKSIFSNFWVAYILIAALLPFLYKLNRRLVKYTSDESDANKNRIIYGTTVLLIISFAVYTFVSVVTIDRIVNEDNKSISRILSDDLYMYIYEHMSENESVEEILASDSAAITQHISELSQKYNVEISITNKIQTNQGDEEGAPIHSPFIEEIDDSRVIEFGNGYLIIKQIPESDYYIVVRRNVDSLKIFRENLANNLIVLVIVFALFIFIAYVLLNRNSTMMERSLQFRSYETLKNMFDGVYLIDRKTGYVSEIKNILNNDDHIFEPSISISDQKQQVLENWVDREHWSKLLALFEFDSLESRFIDRNFYSAQFIINDLGWCRGSLVVVRDKKTNDIDHMIFNVEIIEAEIRKEREMREETEAAKAASEAKGRFLANVSHEIRTPINAVLGFDTMILRESSETEIREYAANIQNAGNTLLSLINDILDFSKIESGKMNIVPVEYDLSSLITDIDNMMSIKAEGKGLDFILDIDTDLPSALYGDDIRIKQVLLNVINNAVKYTEKGSVTFKVSGHYDQDNYVLRFLVKDTGIGIKQEDMPKLFGDFERIEESKNRKVEGTGLGMSITTSILGLMGSKLQVNSVYGEGSEFFFDLIQEVRDAEPIGDLAKHKIDVSSIKYEIAFTAKDANILVVDDSKLNVMVFKGLLKNMEMNIDSAEDGKTALEKMTNNPYDIIFMDHMMPDMDGIEVLSIFKDMVVNGESVINADTPVIVLTANAISGVKEQYVNAGFIDYISKPIIPEKLERLIDRYVPEEKKVR